jgi:hypothetical protein
MRRGKSLYFHPAINTSGYASFVNPNLKFPSGFLSKNILKINIWKTKMRHINEAGSRLFC